MAARTQNLERQVFFGLIHQYTVQLMIDTDNGKIHAGILGDHIMANTVAEAADKVQEIIDTHESIVYRDYLVFDLSREPDEISSVSVRIGVDAGFPSDGRLLLNREYYVVRPDLRIARWERIPASHLVVEARSTLARHVTNNVKALYNAHKRMLDHQHELESLRYNSHPAR